MGRDGLAAAKESIRKLDAAGKSRQQDWKNIDQEIGRGRYEREMSANAAAMGLKTREEYAASAQAHKDSIRAMEQAQNERAAEASAKTQRMIEDIERRATAGPLTERLNNFGNEFGAKGSAAASFEQALSSKVGRELGEGSNRMSGGSSAEEGTPLKDRLAKFETDERRRRAADMAASAARGVASAGRGMASGGRQMVRLGQAGIGAGGAMASAARDNSVNIFFWIAIIFHIADSIMSYKQFSMRFTFYFAMAVIGWLWIFKGGAPVLSQESLRALGKSTGIALAAFLMPILMLRLSGMIDPAMINIFIVWFPFYLIWLVFVEPSTEHLQKLQKWIVAIWLFIGIMAVYKAAQAGSLGEIPLLHNDKDTDFFGAIGNVWQMLWGSIKELWDAIVKFIMALINGLSGGWGRLTNTSSIYNEMFPGKVDSAAKLKLGVYLENVKTSEKEYLTGSKIAEPINIWATLVAKTLEKDIRIAVECWMNVTEGKDVFKINADAIYPNDKFGVYDSGETEEDIDCLFKRETVSNSIKKAGTYKAYIRADFNFETRAYLKSYFIDKEKALALKRQDIDPLKQFGIDDRNPIAIYTNGPIQLGMELKKVPVEVNRENAEENRFTLGISLKNNWDGEVTKITSVRVMMPKEITITEGMCSGIYFREAKCSSTDWECDDNFHNIYEMSDSIVQGIQDEKSFRCPLQIEDTDSLLGDTPISTRYFKVITEYEYRLQKSQSVKVVEAKA